MTLLLFSNCNSTYIKIIQLNSKSCMQTNRFMFIIKNLLQINDDSGEIEVIQWVEDGNTLDEFAEGTNVKVFGSLR